ncbi:MAG: restriction endonuclease [Spirochaetia bacterium]|nr:restriction endonuclease [Spirochaetia bacterium]
MYLFIKQNFSNIFTVVGILITLYFGIFYIPAYVEESKNEKILRMNDSLIEQIQEIIYNDNEIDEEFIKTLIKGHEMKYNISYPFTAKELLTQAQERFMTNRFIKLETRLIIFENIKNLKKSFGSDMFYRLEQAKKESMIDSFIIILSIIVSILSGVFGIISVLFKAQRNKELEIDENISKKENEIKNSVLNSIDFERSIQSLLDDLSINYKKERTMDRGFDFEIESNKRHYFLEIKLYQTPISITVIERIIGMAHEKKGDLILITTSNLTKTAKNFIDKYNKIHDCKFYSIESSDLEEIKEKLKKIIR